MTVPAAADATKRPPATSMSIDELKAELRETEESGPASAESKHLEGTDVENGVAPSMAASARDKSAESRLQHFKEQFKEHTCKKLLAVAIGLALFVGGCVGAARGRFEEWWVPLILCGMGLLFGTAPCQKGVRSILLALSNLPASSIKTSLFQRSPSNSQGELGPST